MDRTIQHSYLARRKGASEVPSVGPVELARNDHTSSAKPK